MIYWFNEARNVEEYRAEKAAREKAEKDKKDKQYSDRYYHKNKGTYGHVSKTRADGHTDLYHGDMVGSRNREDELDLRNRKYHGHDDEDFDRDVYARLVARRNTKSPRERHEIEDAANRNMRRHPERWDRSAPVKPKTESTIFDNIEIV